MKSKRLAGLVLSGFIALAPVSVAAFSEKKIEATNKVGLVYKLSEKEGLRQLRDLAAKGSKEDGWYYLVERGEWIDHGTNIEPGEYTPKKDVLLNIKGIRDLTIYSTHIHPASDDLEKRANGLFPPSIDDMIYYLQALTYFEKYGIDVKEFRQVDRGGYWAINLETSDMKEIRTPEFIVEYNELIFNYYEEYRRMYRINEGNNILGTIERFYIRKFERDAAALGLDVEYNYID